MWYISVHMATPKTDDLDAVRVVVDAIKDFSAEEQQRIFRWAAEKLDLPQPFAVSIPPLSSPPELPSGIAPSANPHAHPPSATVATNIKTFIAEKKPRNDVQFAATVAYYYRFEAPQAERKEAINKEDLQEATRKAGRDRFTNPLTTLANAHRLGLLDKGSEKATFTINSVGENLVAMTLPDGSAVTKAGKKKGTKSVPKKAGTKKAKKA